MVSRFRWRLSTLLIAVAAFAMVFGTARAFADRYVGPHAKAIAFPLALGAVHLGVAYLATARTVPPGRNRFLIAVLVVSVAGAAYTIWARYRVSEAFFSDIDAHSWPRNWPYPDPATLALNDYYDHLYPVFGALKLHREYPRVRRALELVIALLSVIAGAGLAVLVPFAPPRPDPSSR